MANKQTHDCIYFSGVDVDQLQWFLDWLRYPLCNPPISSGVTATTWTILLFDVGFRLPHGAEVTLRILKSGYYGVF